MPCWQLLQRTPTAEAGSATRGARSVRMDIKRGTVGVVLPQDPQWGYEGRIYNGGKGEIGAYEVTALQILAEEIKGELHTKTGEIDFPAIGIIRESDHQRHAGRSGDWEDELKAQVLVPAC